MHLCLVSRPEVYTVLYNPATHPELVLPPKLWQLPRLAEHSLTISLGIPAGDLSRISWDVRPGFSLPCILSRRSQ